MSWCVHSVVAACVVSIARSTVLRLVVSYAEDLFFDCDITVLRLVLSCAEDLVTVSCTCNIATAFGLMDAAVWLLYLHIIL